MADLVEGGRHGERLPRLLCIESCHLRGVCYSTLVELDSKL